MSIAEPVVVFEVLSDSTEVFDRGDKMAACRQLASLREYVLVPMPGRPVEVNRRCPDGSWSVSFIAGGSLRLESLDRSLPVERLYDDLL